MSDEPKVEPGLLSRIRPIAAIVLGAGALIAIATLALTFWNALWHA
jgi:hypothetical protein